VKYLWPIKIGAESLAEPVRMLGRSFSMLDNDVSHIAQTHQNQTGVEISAEDNADSSSNRQFLKQHTG
jgi:hypothetical protein